MIVYEVNLDIDAGAFAEYRAWLDAHAGEMLALPGFVSAEIFECREPAPIAGRRQLVVTYRLADAPALERYLREDAPRLRADGIARFGGKFNATRRVLAPA